MGTWNVQSYSNDLFFFYSRTRVDFPWTLALVHRAKRLQVMYFLSHTCQSAYLFLGNNKISVSTVNILTGSHTGLANVQGKRRRDMWCILSSQNKLTWKLSMSKWNRSTGLIEAFRSANVTTEGYLITDLSDIFLNNGGIFKLSIANEILIEKLFYHLIKYYWNPVLLIVQKKIQNKTLNIRNLWKYLKNVYYLIIMIMTIYLFYNLIIIYVTAGQCILHKNEKLRYIFMR